MTIPDYQSIMLPLLKLTGDGDEHSLQHTRRITTAYLPQEWGFSALSIAAYVVAQS